MARNGTTTIGTIIAMAIDHYGECTYIKYIYAPQQFKVMKIVKIKWLDATGIKGPISKKQIMEQPVLEINTVGFLIHEDDMDIRVANQTDGRKFRNVSIIPKAYVVKWEEIETSEND